MKALKYISILTLSVSLFACDKDENKVENPPIENESELITTVKLTITDSADTLSYQFRDPDGEGGANATVDTLKLKSGHMYNVTLQLLDESNPSKIKNITEEVEEEANDHLVCYSNNTNINVMIMDKDGNNLPLGLDTHWMTAEAADGSLTLKLRHQPGIKDGYCDKGETDVEVVFPVSIR